MRMKIFRLLPISIVAAACAVISAQSLPESETTPASVFTDSVAVAAETHDSLSFAEPSVSGPDTLRLEIDRLQDENASLSLALRESRDSLETCRKKLITVAGNFLYIPYEEYGVEKIAIPAYRATEGSELYQVHIARLELLESYGEDRAQICDFLKKNKGTILYSSNLVTSLKELKAKFDALPAVKNYRDGKYKNWKETYLGGIIVEVDSILSISSVSDTNATVKKVESVFESNIRKLQ